MTSFTGESGISITTGGQSATTGESTGGISGRQSTTTMSSLSASDITIGDDGVDILRERTVFASQ